MSRLNRIKIKSLCLAIAWLTSQLCFAQSQGVEKAAQAINAEHLLSNTKVLSSDEFEGRLPASKGEQKTMDFLSNAFTKLGFEPGVDGSFFQSVPLVEITPDPAMVLNISGQKLQYGTDFVAVTKHVTDSVQLKPSELVFVGYGAVSPENDWNDYSAFSTYAGPKGINIKDKTVIVLVNDPGFASNDPALFNGKAMTYYGRWSYKYEEATRQDAAAVFVVHEREPASYPWAVVRNGWSGPQFDLAAKDNNKSRIPVEGWLSIAATKALFKRAGLNFKQLKQAALQKNFKAVPLGLKASLTINNQFKRQTSRNFIAQLTGSERPEEKVIYTAHWDHLGKDDNLKGDQIYNGALDNATGTAGLIELARAYKKLLKKPARTVVLVAVTAEEQGLLGSQYMATSSIWPTSQIVAALNMDSLNIFGPTKDVVIVGYGNSQLDRYVEQVAAFQHRIVKPDPSPQSGGFYRSDHFSFAKVGVPALYLGRGTQHIEKGEAWFKQQLKQYVSNHYHKPSDEVRDEWNLSGAVQDLRLLFRVGLQLANSSDFPNWHQDNEFRDLRNRDLAAAKAKR